ncbi:MAG: HAMP domain-containing sensor histidine kinase [Planctomycetota bacterium]
MTTATATVKRAVYDLPLVARAPDESSAVAADGPLLLHHAEWFCKLRWLVVVAMLALALVASLTGDWLLQYGIRLQASWPLGVAGALVLANVAYLAMLRVVRNSPNLTVAADRCLWLQILVDLAVLTAVVHFLGSVETVAPLMVLFHIVLVCIFFSSVQSLAVTGIALAMYVLCVALESSGILQAQSVWASFSPAARSELPDAVLAAHVFAVAFISLTIWFLASRLAGALRQRDAELAATNRRLMAATDERARHMLQTTHQLKAPFAAIHANTQVLLGGFCGKIPHDALQVIGKIANRCEMLSGEIKAMLQLANLRSNAQDPPKPTTIELHELLRTSLTAMEPLAAKRGIRFVENIASATIRGVHDHIVMMIDNILSNAVAYSFDGQQVSVACQVKPSGGAIVTVEDSGIGIPTTKLPLIFDDYYHTAEAVKQNKASTGLGLAIVRQVAMADKVGVRVESAPQQGTLFTLDFPACWGEPIRLT